VVCCCAEGVESTLHMQNPWAAVPQHRRLERLKGSYGGVGMAALTLISIIRIGEAAARRRVHSEALVATIVRRALHPAMSANGTRKRVGKDGRST
jgi:hypothetical protein